MKQLIFALVTFLVASSAALAATIVEPGSSTVIVETADDISEFNATKGTIFVNEGEDGLNRLIFIAPKDLPVDPIEIRYQLDGEESNRAFQIRDGAAVFGSNQVYEASLKALFILFVLAVVVESGLQLVFRWRPYLSIFDTSGTNAVIAFAFSLFFVSFFKLDIASRLVNAYLGTPNGFENSAVGYVLTAMIIGGGSAGVNRLFRSFGIRPIGPPAEVAGPVDQTTAWISVSINRVKAEGVVTVLYGEEGKESVIGTINGSSGTNRWKLINMFFRDKGRFPQSGGYRVDATEQNRIVKIIAENADGKPVPVSDWGPYPIGPRAIIDIKRDA